jgi:hypothetical protein
MPQIKQFEAPALGLQPTEIGVEATAQAANRIGRFYNQVAGAKKEVGDEAARGFSSAIKDAGQVAVEYAEHKEISHGAATFAQLNDNLTNVWNDTAKKADPNDPTVAEKFNEGVLEPALEQYRKGFLTEGGQKFAEARIEALRNHMFTKTAADMSSLAADAVSVNMKQTANSLSNTAMQDPSSVPHLLDSTDALVGGMVDSSPNIKGTAASKAKLELTQKMKESIVKAGVIGTIDKTGTIPKWAYEDRFSGYIDGAEIKQFEKYAQAQQRANLLTQKQLVQFQKQEQADSAHSSLSKNFTDSVSFDENGKVTIKPQFFKNVMEIEKQYPGAATERAKAMINWGQSEQREKRETIITDKATHASLYDGLFRTDNPTSDVDILKAAADKKLDAHDTSVLMNLSKALEEQPLKGPLYQGTMAAVKNIFGDSDLGHERYATFLQNFIPEYLKQQRAGTVPANALDIRDPKSLISQSMAGLTLTPQEKMMGQIMKRIGGGGEISGNMMEMLQTKPVKTESIKLPPLNQRTVGEIYRTPNGNKKWTGTGWANP